MDKLKSPTLLDRHHDVDDFDCGVEPLNNFLKNFALVNNQNGSAKTYVTTKSGKVVGYYTITIGSVNKETAPHRIGKGLAAHPVPVIIIARFAVDKAHQGHGIGKAIICDALLKIVEAAGLFLSTRKMRRPETFTKNSGLNLPPSTLFIFTFSSKILRKLSDFKNNAKGICPSRCNLCF